MGKLHMFFFKRQRVTIKILEFEAVEIYGANSLHLKIGISTEIYGFLN